MLKLEKVFQNNDSAYIYFVTFLKFILLFLSIYIFSILEKNTIYDLFDYSLFIKSEYFIYSLAVTSIYLAISISIKDTNNYQKNFLSFLKEDLLSLIASNIFIFSIFFIIGKNFYVSLSFLYLFLVTIIVLFLSKIYFNHLYKNLIDKNIIQKNVMLIGKFKDIKKIISDDVDDIYVFKCCMILDEDSFDKKLIKSELKFPVFNIEEDIRSILEYHALGQIWLLNDGKEKQTQILSKIIKWSVDIIILNLFSEPNLKGKALLANKYNYEFYEISRFHGAKFFLKIIIDKVFSIIFLILSSPILLVSSLLIYIEDGFPILFTQNRTGWDGRRFKIYKLRTLKKTQFDKTIQVGQGDKRVLKTGKLIRRFSIDEVPQFINVLNGDMSIVGPRPHMVEHDIRYSKLFENFLKRHKCNPGLTGWAQVNGLRGATPNPEAMKRRMEYDLWYLNNWTIYLDIYIILKTFYALIKYKGD